MQLKKGDRVDRRIGKPDNCLVMPMIVRKVENGLIYAAAEGGPDLPDDEVWMFEELTGVEYDPDLKWGTEFGATGSVLVGPIKCE